MNRRIFALALCAMLFALYVPAQAQQTGKIFRVGYLDASTATGSAVLVSAFRQELAKLGRRAQNSNSGEPGDCVLEYL
jgi:hypothetical protein